MYIAANALCCKCFISKRGEGAQTKVVRAGATAGAEHKAVSMGVAASAEHEDASIGG